MVTPIASKWFFSLFFYINVVVLSTECGSGSSSGRSDAPSNNPPPPTPAPAPELSGLAPATLAFDLQAGESASVALSFTNSGTAALTYELASSASQTWITLASNASGSVAAGGSAGVSVTVVCGSVDLSGVLTLTTNDTDEASTNIPVAAVCSVPPSNVEIARVVLNQGARAFDSDLSADLSIGIIAGRELLVRAFVTGSGVVPDARVVVQTTGQAVQFFAMQTPTAMGTTPADESLLNGSHYVVLPGSAIGQNTSVRIEVNPSAIIARYPQSGSIDLSVSDPGPLNITFVPITFQDQTPIIDDAYLQQTLGVLPIGSYDIEIRTPYTFTAAYDLSDLLQEVADLRTLDGSNRLYHGIITAPGGSGSQTAGVAYVGFPVSVSIDLNGSQYIIAHEIGHNLNLGHAPGCSAPNADPNYPNADGAVTTWGFDVNADALVAPSNRTDFMSYCNDVWVSDYHFDRALQHRSGSVIGFGPPAGRGLTISGQIQHGEVVNLTTLVTAQVMQASELDNAAFRFVGWDLNGIEVVNRIFSAYRIEDHNEMDGFAFNIPLPNSDIHTYQILHSGAEIDTGQLNALVSQSVAANWSGREMQLTWDAAPGVALIVRDDLGRVLSVDRTGLASVVSPTTSASIELRSGMGSSVMQPILRGTDKLVRWVGDKP